MSMERRINNEEDIRRDETLSKNEKAFSVSQERKKNDRRGCKRIQQVVEGPKISKVLETTDVGENEHSSAGT